MPICEITVPCIENVDPNRENVVPSRENPGDRSGLREIRSRLMQFPCHCARFHGTSAVPTSATRVPFSEKKRSIFVLTRTNGTYQAVLD